MSEYKAGGYTTKINGKTIPHAKFPVGSFYDDSLVPRSMECVGFGKYISNYLYGSENPGTVVDKQDMLGNTADMQCYNIIKGFRIGSRLTGWKNGNQLHTWILLSCDTSGAVIYHANFAVGTEKRNIVKISKWTYADFTSRYDQISGYNAPKPQ